jgi:hypothetical protein
MAHRPIANLKSMSFIAAFLQEAAPFQIWVAARTDHVLGSGKANDPYNGSARYGSQTPVTLTRGSVSPYDFEALADSGAVTHGFQNGDLVAISGAESNPNAWNGIFLIYGVTSTSFKYYMRIRPTPSAVGRPICRRVTLSLDEILRTIPANTRINVGPGLFQTRGFAVNDSRGWQPKSGQKVIGAGFDVTTLQLIGAENAGQHYHVVGMPIESSGPTAITPLSAFEISDLTIDCNVDNQPTRLDRHSSFPITLSHSGTTATADAVAHGLREGDLVAITGDASPDAGLWNGMFRIGNVQDDSFDYIMSDSPTNPTSGTVTALKVVPYPNVACGAVRILGTECRVRNVKAVNWGTKSLRQGCFVISIIQASAEPSDGNLNPIVTETKYNGIEDCICVQPSKTNARETTVLHIGGIKNPDNHAQAFGSAAFIRKNFVDCSFATTFDETREEQELRTPRAFPSAFITSKAGTLINTATGTFVGKRPHYRNELDTLSFVRFYHPRDPKSRWNGYFQITPFGNDTLAVLRLPAPSPSTTNDSSFVVMGTEFRGIGVSGGINLICEQNQIHNCWIGGPYQSPLDDSVTAPGSPLADLGTEERTDKLNGLSTRSIVVRNSFYRNVVVGPYFNMGGKSDQVLMTPPYSQIITDYDFIPEEPGFPASEVFSMTAPYPITLLDRSDNGGVSWTLVKRYREGQLLGAGRNYVAPPASNPVQFRVRGNQPFAADAAGIARLALAQNPHLWLGARISIEPDEAYAGNPSLYQPNHPLVGLHEIAAINDLAGYTPSVGFQVPVGTTFESAYLAYRIVSGIDRLIIEGNQIWLSDLDETEFAIKEYPIALSPTSQLYRPYGIIVADNGLSREGGPYVHGQVVIENNKISYVDTEVFPTPEGIGKQAGGGMMLSGIKQLHVTHNLVEIYPRNPLRTYRCGMARFFNNKKPNGTIVPGWKWDTDGHYDEPETLIEDAFILALLLKGKRTHNG